MGCKSVENRLASSACAMVQVARTGDETAGGEGAKAPTNFPRRVLHFSRNYYIKSVVLFEENSIILLPERLESSEW